MKEFRWPGGLAVVLLALGAGTQTPIHSETPREDAARQAAWRLAKDAIQPGAGPRIPDFVSWPTARDIYPCEGRLNRSTAIPDLFDESFHYNSKAVSRMCGPLTNAPGSPPMDRALEFWEHSNPKASMIDPSFPEGARLGAAFWDAVRLPAGPNEGKIVDVPIRSGNLTLTRKIRITIPEDARAAASACGPPRGSGAPPVAGVQDVSLDDFFKVRLAPGERYNGAACGDFAVLVAFHLVHKDHGRWLWTTFWWDPDSREFGAGRPRNFQGAGDHPRAWANYAMDASDDSTNVIFNPWRAEERGRNCASCHAEVTVRSGQKQSEKISFDFVTAAHAHFK